VPEVTVDLSMLARPGSIAIVARCGCTYYTNAASASFTLEEITSDFGACRSCARREARENFRATSPWRLARFSLAIGYDNEPVVEAWTQGETWNGWATPFFTEDQVNAMLAAFQAFPPYVTSEAPIVGTFDGFTVSFPNGYSEEDGGPFDTWEATNDGPLVDLLGESVWGVGAFSWTWQEEEVDPT
jgi:hypothetical protein